MNITYRFLSLPNEALKLFLYVSVCYMNKFVRLFKYQSQTAVVSELKRRQRGTPKSASPGTGSVNPINLFYHSFHFLF